MLRQIVVNKSRASQFMICFVLSLLTFLSLENLSHAEGVYDDQFVQPSRLEMHARGSLAGEYSGTSFNVSGLSKGSFSLPLGIRFPELRGPLVFPFVPQYSTAGGISEWGMGISVDLSIRRFRTVGQIDFLNDDFLSPWGRLVRGSDGDYYPTGLQTPVRVRFSKEDAEVVWAFLPDGTQLTFGRRSRDESFAGLKNSGDGVYSWYLVEAKNRDQQFTYYSYEKSDQNAVYLKEIQYGGTQTDFQYRILFQYSLLTKPFLDYRSTLRQELDRRIERIGFQTKSLGSQEFVLSFSYLLTHELSDVGPGFYLSSLQKVLGSGVAEPAIRFHYHTHQAFLGETQWQRVDKINPFLQAYGNNLLNPKYSTQLDFDLEGLTSLEVPGRNFSVLKQSKETYLLEALPIPDGGVNPLCRNFQESDSTVRFLARMRGVHSPLEVVRLRYDSSTGNTNLIVCTREGQLTQRIDLPGNWELGKTIRLVDIRNEGKPDLIKVQNAQYKILRNHSSASELKFDADPIVGQLFKSDEDFHLPSEIYLQDINGDGIPDLVGRYSDRLRVWYGKGHSEFDVNSVAFPLVDLRGEYLSFNKDWKFVFQDLNGDGIADLIVYKLDEIRVFFADGNRFVQKSVRALRASSNYPWLSEGVDHTSVPLTGDFLGSGNSQITVVAGGKAYAVEFNFPDVGLLGSVDDGKGSVLNFEYVRAQSEKGIGNRMPVLAQMKIYSSGKGTQSYRYEYAGPQTHTLNRSFLGFSSVAIDEKQKRVEGRFYQDDEIPTLLTESYQVDRRNEAIQKFVTHEYESTEFLGVPYRKLKRESQGYRHAGSAGKAVQVNQEYLEYDDEFCPSLVKKTDGSSVLTTQTQYFKSNYFLDHLTCFSSQIKTQGEHFEDPSQDFRYSLFTDRDRWAHPITLRTGSGISRILNTVSYRNDHRLASVFLPEKGTTFFDYDSAYRLVGVHAPDGTQIQSEYSLSGTDLMNALTQIHGVRDRSHGSGMGDEGFRQNRGYDPLERLSQVWNNVDESSLGNPLETYDYQYATALTPGWIDVKSRLESLTGSVTGSIWKKVRGFQSADGKSIGNAIASDGGWVITGLTSLNPEDYQKTIYSPQLMGPTLDGVSVEDLFTGSVPVQEEMGSSIREKSLSQKQVYQAGVVGEIKTQLEIVNQNSHSMIQVQQIENDNTAYTRIEQFDAHGKKTFEQDEEGNHTHYQYDALGRLSRVSLANGDLHQVHYDQEGRIQEVVRTDLGKVAYAYRPGTSLIQSKKYYGRESEGTPSKLARSVEFEYDSAGRVTRQIEKNWDDRLSPPQVYHFYYDGKNPKAGLFSRSKAMLGHLGFLAGLLAKDEVDDIIPGQQGFLTAVQGPGFLRKLRYRLDGKLSRAELQFSGWKTWIQTYDYQLDGSIRAEVSELKEGTDSTSSFKVTQRKEWDHLGRVSKLFLNDSELAVFRYDPYSQIDKIILKNSDVIQNEYDSVTRQVKQISEWIAQQEFKNSRSFNSRGLIENESLQFKEKGTDIAYEYSLNGNLISEKSSEGNHHYSYGKTGILTSPQNDQYLLDHLGRVSKTPEMTVSYGPNGRVEKLVRPGKSDITYSYDETGKRITKREGGRIVEAYVEGWVLTPDQIYKPVQVNGHVIGVVEKAQFVPLVTDLKNSVLNGTQGTLNFVSSYGERAGERSKHSRVVDYVSQGYDPDLKAYRMEQRDYDPVLKRFLTPDPLFLEQPELCINSPKECNLYGYAKGNPVSFVDPSGLDSYRMDREIGKGVDTPRPWNESKTDWSHTFIAVTEKVNGVEKVTDTFSWGNDGKSWFHNAANDMSAAGRSLENGFGFKISDNPGMDQAFKEAFTIKAQDQPHLWLPWDSCKQGADALTDLASSIAHSNAEHIDHILQSNVPEVNSSKINDFY